MRWWGCRPSFLRRNVVRPDGSVSGSVNAKSCATTETTRAPPVAAAMKVFCAAITFHFPSRRSRMCLR